MPVTNSQVGVSPKTLSISEVPNFNMVKEPRGRCPEILVVLPEPL